MTRHLYIPDVQFKDGVPDHHLRAVGNMIAELQPEVIICAGDFADMPSLSGYDIGKRTFEGRRYKDDIAAAHRGMRTMLGPMERLNYSRRRNKVRLYKPRMVMTLGNHENRIDRATNNDPKLYGTIGIDDLQYSSFGWNVVPFLQPVIIDGVAYCHYFYNKLTGRPWPNARTTLNKEHISCTQGHQQKLEIEVQYDGKGRRLTSVTAGAYYLHDEEYKGEAGNKHWRGILWKSDVHDGEYDLATISIDNMVREWL